MIASRRGAFLKSGPSVYTANLHFPTFGASKNRISVPEQHNHSKGKVAFVVPYKFVPPVNGGHKAAYGFCEYLSKELEVVCYSSKDNRLETPPPFKLDCLFSDSKFKYINPFLLLRFYISFKKKKISVCVLHQHFMGLLLWPLLKIMGIPMVVFVQNIEFQRFKSMGKWWWRMMFWTEKWIYKKSSHLFFISGDDQKAAIDIFQLDPAFCVEVPYGTSYKSPPVGNKEARKKIVKRHGLDERSFLILFFGPLSYQPNMEAVSNIVDFIVPLLKHNLDFRFKFLICGGGLPENKKEWISKDGVSYLGFVEDIDEYVMAADLIINPVTTGGGVKTKVVEAIALNKTVLSSMTGLIGMHTEPCGQKLIGVGDHDYGAYCNAILRNANANTPNTPTSFYDFYYWGNTVRAAVDVLKRKTNDNT